LLLAATCIFSLSFSQGTSISPNESSEFCPLTDITFTVTLPRIAENTTPTVISFTNTPFVMSGVSNLAHTSTQTTFTFVGRFRDVNIAQAFRVQYATSSNPSVTYDPPPFKRIKSLFYPTSCAQIPNQATITAPRCEAVNIPITISNVKWGAWGENPELCFGTITDYEYGLPAGWSIGSNVSTGSNWIPGGNSVTVTSDLSNGGAILVRPRNTCGGATANGQTPGQIPINRPAPSLAIPETQTDICSGSKTFTLTGLPAGATTTWSVTNNYGVASLSNPTNTSVEVNKIGSGNGREILKATVTHCSFTYPVEKDIYFGAQTPTYIDYSIDPLVICNEVRVTTEYIPTATYTWSYFKQPYSGNIVQFPNSASTRKLTLSQGSGTYSIGVTATTGCGTGDIYYIGVPIDCEDGGGHRFAVSPNPASNTITVQQKEKTNITIKEIKIFDNFGNLKKQSKYGNGTIKAQINITDLKTGIYVIEILGDQNKERQQLIIQK
jgi:hypothetical protein